MSEKTQEKRRDTVTAIDASHLNENFSEKEENWTDVTPTSPITEEEDLLSEDDEFEDDEFEDDELEQELSSKEPVTPATPSEKEVVTAVPQELLGQLEQFQSNMPSLITALDTRLKEIAEQRKALDEEQQSVAKRLNFLRRLNGDKPVDDAPRRKRGRRPNSEKLAEAAANGTVLPTPTETRPRKRPYNEMTFQEAILRALLVMTHNGKPYTAAVNDITVKVTLPKEEGGMGYNTQSSKANNTVRIQLYRLEDKQKVIQNNDKTFSLKQETIEELKKEIAPVSETPVPEAPAVS